ncbi:hypothetical protein SSX86_025626 [Deinandra increscens subsp. villosa]|uniref:Ribosomal protein L19 n=1 Tax=Deinandra increscens subsp. villosa TaxID=3103831 RepID=A0AAP0CJJ4_9ASTR
MHSFCGRIRLIAKNAVNRPHTFDSLSSRVCSSEANHPLLFSRLLPSHFSAKNYGSLRELPASCKMTGIPSVTSAYREAKPGFSLGARILTRLTNRGITTLDESHKSDPQNATPTATEATPRIKFKRLDKTARHIMQACLYSYFLISGKTVSVILFKCLTDFQILDKEAVEDVRTHREIPEIKPGYIIQFRLEVPENKRRVSTLKGIVIARRNAGLNTTIRLRRMVAGVGVESLLPLYSPNIKEIKVLDKKKVRRAKLYYLRDKMNALRK